MFTVPQNPTHPHDRYKAPAETPRSEPKACYRFLLVVLVTTAILVVNNTHIANAAERPSALGSHATYPTAPSQHPPRTTKPSRATSQLIATPVNPLRTPDGATQLSNLNAWTNFYSSRSTSTGGDSQTESPAPLHPELVTLHRSAKTLPLPAARVTTQTLDQLHSPLLRRDLKLDGAMSCAAASCHGGPRPGIAQPTAMRGNENLLWFENDPHSRSWRTICSEASVAMMNRLKILDGTRIIDKAGFDNCLACHNTTLRYDEPRSTEQHLEGVGCAGCHGPSEKWIGTHFQNGWASATATHDGFVNNADLYTRARMCASCHVGDKDRDMNHDIIAAGHPALRYELATFHAWQPKHWRDSEANDRTYYEAQLWLAGQVAATDASLSLLETRASGTRPGSTWPELASLDCVSCHHSLGFENDRTLGPAPGPAIAPLAQWNDAGLRWVIDYRRDNRLATPEDELLIEALDRVRGIMKSGVSPDQRETARAANFARLALAHWFHGDAGSTERRLMRSERLGRVIASAAGRKQTWETWESAAQFYLALVAARESWPGGWSGPLSTPAESMRQGLRYPGIRQPSTGLVSQASASETASTRAETMRLGILLAGWLGNVTLELPESPRESTYDLGDEDITQLRVQLQEINKRWADRKPAPKTTDPVAPDQATPNMKPKPADAAPDTPAKPKRTLEDLRKSLEALQGGDE